MKNYLFKIKSHEADLLVRDFIDAEIRRTGRVSQAYYKWPLECPETSDITDVFAIAGFGSNIIVRSIGDLDLGPGLYNNFKDISEKKIILRILDPEIVIDVQDESDLNILRALCSVSKKAAPAQGLPPLRKISDEIIGKIRNDRRKGDAFKKIADRYGLAYNTVRKYTDDIETIPQELKKLAPPPEPEKKFQAKDIRLPVPLSSEIHGDIRRFITSKPNHKTRADYSREISRFLRNAQERGKEIEKVTDIGVDWLDSYKSEIMDKHWGNSSGVSTALKHFRIISSFFNYCRDVLGKIPENPVKCLDLPSDDAPVVRTQAFSPDELKRFLTVASERKEKARTKGAKFCAERNFLFFWIIARLGERSGTVRDLRKKHVNMLSGELTLSFYRKRTIHPAVRTLDPVSTRMVSEYMDRYMKDVHEDGYVFYTRGSVGSRKLHSSDISDIYKDVREEAGLADKKLTSHSMRVSLAKRKKKAGLGVHEIQAIMGHKRVEQTIKYMQILVDDSENDLPDIPGLPEVL